MGASVFSRGAFETPLGRVAVDDELATAFEARDSHIRFIREAHDREHCLEMQLPFLQVLMPGMSIVPIVIGDQRKNIVERVAQAISDGLKGTAKRVLLVASSDLSHYKSAQSAASMDGRIRHFVEEFDAPGLMDLIEENHEHACGGGAIVAVMMAAKALGATAARVMRYGDSGDVTGDKSQVVGYLSAAILR
jgi:AmmeMemoRadiSam system protein B